MRKIFSIALLLLLLLSSSAFASRGVIAFYNDRTDKIIIQTESGYTCGDVMSVHVLLDSGQFVAGDLEMYGSHQIYNLTTDESMTVWIDEYWLTSEQAMDWLQHN